MNSLSEEASIHVRGGKCSYKSSEQSTSAIMIATVFFSFSDPLPLGSLFSFILHLFLHLYPTRGQLMAQADTCPISLLQKSLEDGYKAGKVLFRGHFLINAASELAIQHSMLWQQFSLRYFWVPIFLVHLWCTSLSLELLGRSF